MRDVICNELSPIPRREIYITAAAVTYVVLHLAPVPRDVALLAGITTGFCIPAAAILRG